MNARTAADVSLVSILLLTTLFLLGACTTRQPLPGPVVEVQVPVAVPCEIDQVDTSPLPSAEGVPNDIFDAVKIVLADRALLKADREKLKAANTSPCPEI